MRWGREKYTTFRELEGTDDLGNPDYLNLCTKPNKYTSIKYVLSYIINCQHVSIAFTIIIRVALQQYSKCNKLPTCISGTTERYNRCLRLFIWSQNVSLHITKNR